MQPSTRALLTLLALCTTATDVHSQQSQSHASRIHEWRRQNERAILDEAFAFLALPNVASDSIGIERNADWLIAAFAKRGVAMRTLRAPSGGRPVVYGELRSPNATRTIVFYAHYDGQPVAGGGWDGDPFKPELRKYENSVATDAVALPARGDTLAHDVRIRARSASDDKGPIIAMLAALDAMRANRITPSINIKFFFDGEEEAGNDKLPEILSTHKSLLSADAWIFWDGPMHVSGAPQVVLGVRGVMGVELTFYGPNRALHSGHYGNWAPNPAVAASHFISSVRDVNGRILIDGFYDDITPVTDVERAAAQAVSTTDDSVRKSLGLARTESNNAFLGERVMQPALNLRGIRTGGSTNAVPTSAWVSIDFRLVPGQQPSRIRELTEKHLSKLGYTVTHDANASASSRDRGALVHAAWDEGYVSVKTPASHPIVGALSRIASSTYQREAFMQPLLGGSLPLFHFVEVLSATVITLPIVNADNSQHAPNENLRVGNLWNGIALVVDVASRLGRELPTGRIVPD